MIEQVRIGVTEVLRMSDFQRLGQRRVFAVFSCNLRKKKCLLGFVGLDRTTERPLLRLVDRPVVNSAMPLDLSIILRVQLGQRHQTVENKV